MRVIGISGSLRAGSSNLTLLRSAVRFAPPGMTVEIFDNIGALPHFNPDFDADADAAPRVVQDFRALLRTSDAVLISSPEYAHGVPGTLKNALDWLVSDGTLVGKPVILWTLAPTYGEHAHAALIETLKTMSWDVRTDASLQLRSKTIDPETEGKLRNSLATLQPLSRKRERVPDERSKSGG